MPWITQDGHRIFYQRLDKGDGEETNRRTTAQPWLAPVILHHGLAQWGDDWANAGWLEYFGARAVYAIDALGHGRSDRPNERAAYSVEKRADAAVLVADALGLERFVFFGFSMGGRAGIELAARHPSRVERLIVGGMHGLRPSIDRRNLERRVSVLRSSKWSLVERAVGATRADGRNNDPEALAISTEAVLDWRGADDRLPGLSNPALIYCGALDSLLKYAAETARLMPGCSFSELPATGHAASFYSSESARQLVRDFLDTGSVPA